jgi:hypothetical protein
VRVRSDLVCRGQVSKVVARQDRVCPCGQRMVERRRDDAAVVDRACLVGFATPGQGEHAWADCWDVKEHVQGTADVLRGELMAEMTGRDGNLGQHCVETCAQVGEGQVGETAETWRLSGVGLA